MNIGLKIVPQTTESSAQEIIGLVDFVEVYAKEGEEYAWLRGYDLPVIVHCEHSEDGVNLSNPNEEERNVKAVSWARRLADSFQSNRIILHPGFRKHKGCSLDRMIEFINEHHDKRYLIETMPFLLYPENGQLFCHDTEEVREVSQRCGIGICLDFNHSIGSAVHRKVDWKTFIAELIALGPTHYHISDVDIEKGDEVHLNLFDGQIDFHALKPMIPESAWVTLETPPDREKQKQSIRFLRQ